MKTFLILLCLLPSTLTAAAQNGYSPELIYVLEQLRHSKGLTMQWNPGEPAKALPFVGGADVGMGAPGQFFLLLPYFKNWTRPEDVSRMVKDQSPVIRVMAAYLVAKGGPRFTTMSLASLEKDQAQVEIATRGCIHERLTVAEIVKRIRENPDFFGEEWYGMIQAEEALEAKTLH